MKTNYADAINKRLGKDRTSKSRKPATPIATSRGATKVTVSLYPADVESVREIQRTLAADHGISVSFSEALRLKVRSPIDSKVLLTTRDVIAGEDQRRRPR
jgi:hypothetical protein